MNKLKYLQISERPRNTNINRYADSGHTNICRKDPYSDHKCPKQILGLKPETYREFWCYSMHVA